MSAELGQWCLALALAVALLQATLPLAGAARGIAGWMRIGADAARAQALLLGLAFACLASAFLANDFSLRYVVAHSNSALPAVYRFAAVWGGHEGSLLLWALMLSLWTVLVAWRASLVPPEFSARVLAVLGMISVGFLSFLLFASNPFDRLLPAPLDGADLNPLLQDPGLIVHPPLLYAGYVGYAVPFAAAMACLLARRVEQGWIRWCRPWALGAWVFLTVGIVLGSAWAYYELGWGGWWFWDPVENASFMPWLAGTALLHSLAVTERRNNFVGWTLFLAICAFGLSLLGTFLVRSGVLTSVHAFATDPRRGIFILGLIALLVGGALALFALNLPHIARQSRFRPVSREGLLLLNNVFLSVATASVLLGTLYPLALDALGLGKISVGPPYFEAVFVPLMAPMLFLMGIGPLARWQQASVPELGRRLRGALVAAMAFALLTPWLMGQWSWGVALGLALAGWLAAAVCAGFFERLSAGYDGLSLWQRLLRQPGAFYGMQAAHLGMAVFVAGVTLVGGYASEQVVRLKPGESTDFSGYRFLFVGEEGVAGSNFEARRLRIEVSRLGQQPVMMLPEKRFYPAQRKMTTEAAIERGITRDIYVSLGEAQGDGAWTMHLFFKPFINWIWGGGLMMALGGLLAAADRRYRRRSEESVASTALAPAEAG